MGGSILFISDLHLDPERPAAHELFIDFLQQRAAEADALYILGDLFEIWLGDDAILPTSRPILDALRATSDAGTALHVMHGNRDFLLGDRFCELTGATMLPDPALIRLGDTPTLLMHGDLLCSDDTAYQQFRATVRDPEWQRGLFAMSLEQRLGLARQLRRESRTASGSKSEEIMDVTQSTVEKTMRSHGAQWLIHGHTHRAAEHRFDLDGQPAVRFVLPEWSAHRGGVLCYAAGELRAEPFPSSG